MADILCLDAARTLVVYGYAKGCVYEAEYSVAAPASDPASMDEMYVSLQARKNIGANKDKSATNHSQFFGRRARNSMQDVSPVHGPAENVFHWMRRTFPCRQTGNRYGSEGGWLAKFRRNHRAIMENLGTYFRRAL